MSVAYGNFFFWDLLSLMTSAAKRVPMNPQNPHPSLEAELGGVRLCKSCYFFWERPLLLMVF